MGVEDVLAGMNIARTRGSEIQNLSAHFNADDYGIKFKAMMVAACS